MVSTLPLLDQDSFFIICTTFVSLPDWLWFTGIYFTTEMTWLYFTTFAYLPSVFYATWLRVDTFESSKIPSVDSFFTTTISQFNSGSSSSITFFLISNACFTFVSTSVGVICFIWYTWGLTLYVTGTFSLWYDSVPPMLFFLTIFSPEPSFPYDCFMFKN